MKYHSLDLCTFHVSELYCGLPVEAVQEVMTARKMTPVPRSRAEIRGLVNLRGEVVVAVDLRRRLGLPPQIEREPMQIIVHAAAGQLVSLLVDRIDEIVHVPEERLESVPGTVDTSLRRFVDAVCRLDEALLLQLNLTSLMIEHALVKTAALEEGHRGD